MATYSPKTDEEKLKSERRAKRAERRANQRAQNIGRAEKMHKARISGEYADLFAQSAQTQGSGPHYHIGCSGWFYWDWKGLFYPADMPTSKWFEYYRKTFETVELNASFYSWPTLATVQTWLKQAGNDKFIYTLKVCELITHIKNFRGTKVLVKDFGLIADILGPHMGCFLFQLPPSYGYTAARLKAILGQLDLTRRNVVEFRHASWWNESVFKAFRKAGVVFCSCSGPGMPDQLIKTADDIYIRFHGTSRWYRHDYSKAELADWAERIQKSKAKNIWIYFNNCYEGHAIKNAHQITELLRR